MKNSLAVLFAFIFLNSSFVLGVSEINISLKKIENSTVSSSEKARQFLNAAEELLGAGVLPQFIDATKLAIKYDPSSLEIGLIKAYADLVEVLQSFNSRTKALAQKNPKIATGLINFSKSIQTSLNIPGLASYMAVPAKSDIADEAELQKYVDSLARTIDRLRGFVRKHKSVELSLIVSPFWKKELLKVYTDSCELIITDTYEYQVKCPHVRTRSEVVLNRADFEAIEEIAESLLMFIYTFNAYDLTGFTDVIAKNTAESSEFTAKTFLGEGLENLKFGRLRGGAQIAKVPALGYSMSQKMRGQSLNYQELCRFGYNNSQNRPGSLFRQGVCVGTNPSYHDNLAGLFQGKLQTNFIEKMGSGKLITTSPMALFVHPVKDLRELGPFQFNACGKLIAVGEQTMGGTYPNGDANKSLAWVNQGCDKQ